MNIPLQSMKNVSIPPERPALLARSIVLMKPITWFAPMWAFLCGAIASGATLWDVSNAGRLLLGVIMAGPILCGLSQVMNDYFDREIDAVNEPNRLIPAGLVSISQVMLTIAVLTFLGVSMALYLGLEVLTAVTLGMFLAYAYSAPPFRAKRNGWVGNSLVAVSYEGLAWIAGHLAFGQLTEATVLMALLYSFGTHGIMSINDYKSIDGDKRGGIRTIPVLLGPQRAAWLIVLTMNLSQIGVIAAFLLWGELLFAIVIVGVMLVQLPLQRRFVQQPMENYLKFSAIGVTFFVWGMIFTAVGIRGL
jgi:chlorophyll/bacteriochlorophyll a synthase